MAPTMALIGAAGASMRLPPGARSETMARSSMAAICAALSQRWSRRSRSASMGARSSVWPSISMPRLSSQAPSRAGSCSFSTPRPGLTKGLSSSLPSTSPVSGLTTSFQRCTGTLSCAKPGLHHHRPALGLQLRHLVGPEVAKEFFLRQRPHRAQGRVFAAAPLEGLRVQRHKTHVPHQVHGVGLGGQVALHAHHGAAGVKQLLHRRRAGC